MPDWFYRTCARPALFCLPDPAARAIALGIIGTLGRSRAGRAVVEFMGHMAPAPQLAVRFGGTVFPSRVGLGWRVDPEERATIGLCGFGIGVVEICEGRRCSVTRGPDETLEDGETVTATSPPVVNTGSVLKLV